MKETIHSVLVEKLTDQTYDAEQITPLSKQIADGIKDKLKGMYNRPAFLSKYILSHVAFA